MRAPVYRSIESASTFLGLAFPSEVLLVLTVFWVGALLFPAGSALLATLVTAVALRLATVGRPPHFLQHLVLFHARRLRSHGRLSAAGRTRPQKPFSFAEHATP